MSEVEVLDMAYAGVVVQSEPEPNQHREVPQEHAQRIVSVNQEHLDWNDENVAPQAQPGNAVAQDDNENVVHPVEERDAAVLTNFLVDQGFVQERLDFRPVFLGVERRNTIFLVPNVGSMFIYTKNRTRACLITRNGVSYCATYRDEFQHFQEIRSNQLHTLLQSLWQQAGFPKRRTTILLRLLRQVDFPDLGEN